MLVNEMRFTLPVDRIDSDGIIVLDNGRICIGIEDYRQTHGVNNTIQQFIKEENLSMNDLIEIMVRKIDKDTDKSSIME